jgi:hypothetical protein
MKDAARKFEEAESGSRTAEMAPKKKQNQEIPDLMEGSEGLKVLY